MAAKFLHDCLRIRRYERHERKDAVLLLQNDDVRPLWDDGTVRFLGKAFESGVGPTDPLKANTAGSYQQSRQRPR